MAAEQRPIVLSGNSSWNIVNFRVPLIRALQGAGVEPVIIAPIDPPGEARLAELGLRRFVVDMSRSGLNPIADLRLIARYRAILRQLRPAAYLGFTIKPNIYGCIAARLCGVPAILNISGLGTAFIRQGLLTSVVSALYRFGLRSARVVFFQNADDLTAFVERKLVRSDQAKLLPGSGIDLQRFKPASLPEGPVRFLLIARLLGDKGVREFVESARLLRREGLDARFALLGPLDRANRTAISQSELDGWTADGAVQYLGQTDDVRPFIGQSSAVVLPSYREGLPRSLLEGGAMARPLIATDVPGCRAVVEDGVNGFLCAAQDAGSLADAMRKLILMTPGARTELGQAARRKVHAEFSEELVVRAYLDALGDLAPPRSSTS